MRRHACLIAREMKHDIRAGHAHFDVPCADNVTMSNTMPSVLEMFRFMVRPFRR
jgi:hypothetical protein